MNVLLLSMGRGLMFLSVQWYNINEQHAYFEADLKYVTRCLDDAWTSDGIHLVSCSIVLCINENSASDCWQLYTIDMIDVDKNEARIWKNVSPIFAKTRHKESKSHHRRPKEPSRGLSTRTA